MAKRSVSSEIGFKCESAEFNGPICARQCKSCAGTSKPEWLKDYRIDIGKDGKYGIYTRDYNCRLATFNANTHALQNQLRLLFDHASLPVPVRPKRKKRRTPRVVDRVGGGAFMEDVHNGGGFGNGKRR
jgi:hypothetical protein